MHRLFTILNTVLVFASLSVCFAEEERLGISPDGKAISPHELIETIRKSGLEGQNSAAAREAWNTLSKQSADILPSLLNAVDGKNPLANNYLHSLIDAIVGRSISNNIALPVDKLDAFLQDRRKNPRARRLAYEVIVAADPVAAERLIPTFLDDPSLELRRDAVAQVFEQAEKALGQDKKDAAASLYEKGLKAARDEDQVKLASNKLKELGVAVNLPEHFGFIISWKLIGPFDNVDTKGFAIAYPPETQLDFSAEVAGKSEKVKWIDHTTSDEYGHVDLNKAIGKHMGAIAYAVAEFHSDQPREIDLRLGSDCANKAWLNGQLIHSAEVYKALTKLDQYIAKGQLKAGRNVILLKICQNEQTEEWAQDWKFQCRICDENGTAVLSETPPPAAGTNP